MKGFVAADVIASAVGLLIFLALPLIVIAYYRLRLRVRRDHLRATLSELGLEREYIRVLHLGDWRTLRSSSPRKLEADFDRLFADNFLGRNRFSNFIVPLVLLSVTTFVFGFVGFLSIEPVAAPSALFGTVGRVFPALAVGGATLYVFSLAVVRYASLGLNPHVVLELTRKLWLSAAVGVLLAMALDEPLKPLVAFLGALLPVWGLETLMKKLGSQSERQRTDLDELVRSDEDLLVQLQFAGLRTVVQLAYANPLRLFMDTDLSFQVCVDLVDQANLHLLVPDPDVRKALNLRAVRTATDLMTQTYLEGADGKWDYLGYDEALPPHMQEPMAALAAAMKLSGVQELRNVIGMMIDNPQIGYLHRLWEMMPDVVAELDRYAAHRDAE